jgi:hypothetical protein
MVLICELAERAYCKEVSSIIDDYIIEDRVFVFRRSGSARRGGQSPPYGKSLERHELCQAQSVNEVAAAGSQRGKAHLIFRQRMSA